MQTPTSKVGCGRAREQGFLLPPGCGAAACAAAPLPPGVCARRDLCRRRVLLLLLLTCLHLCPLHRPRRRVHVEGPANSRDHRPQRPAVGATAARQLPAVGRCPARTAPGGAHFRRTRALWCVRARPCSCACMGQCASRAAANRAELQEAHRSLRPRRQRMQRCRRLLWPAAHACTLQCHTRRCSAAATCPRGAAAQALCAASRR